MIIHCIKAFVSVLLVLSVLCACLAGCAPQGQSYTVLGLGSVLQVVDYSASDRLAAYCREIIADVQAAIDPTLATSDIARFNAAADDEWVEVSALTYDIVRTAATCYDLTDGLYDPTVYRSVDLWGFLPRASADPMPYDRTKTADGAYPLPAEAYVAAFASLIDMRKIALSHDEAAGTYALVKHDTATVVGGTTYYAGLDLGGIAKGYVIDKIAAYCRDRGISKGYMSFGASSMLLLANRKGKAWDLSLTNPRPTDEAPTYCTLPAMDVTVSTSGDYQNYYVVDGIRYCHLIDARTGRPMTGDLLSVTVLSPHAAVGDALSTALTVGGLDRLKAFADGDYARENGLEFIAVYVRDGRQAVYSTLDIDIHI